MAGEKANLICRFGGDFISQQGKPFYVGGKTRLVSIDRSASFRSLLSKMSELCDADPSSLDVKFQLPDGGLDSRFISVETDGDVRIMMEEFDSNRKIPIFLFTYKTQNTDDDEIAIEDSVPTLETAATETVRIIYGKETTEKWKLCQLKSHLRDKVVKALQQHPPEEIMGDTRQLVQACLERYFEETHSH